MLENTESQEMYLTTIDDDLCVAKEKRDGTFC